MRQAPSMPDHDVLPENSQGHLADNPDILDMWLTGETIAPSEWPYLILCRDAKDNSLTWHLLCNEHDIPRAIRQGFKALVDDHMSAERNRNLVGIELLFRHGNQHMFLAEDDLPNIA